MKYRWIFLLAVISGLIFSTFPSTTNYESSRVYDPQAYLSNEVVRKVESLSGTKVFVEIRDDFKGQTIEDYTKSIGNTSNKETLGFANVVISPKRSEVSLYLSDNVRYAFGAEKNEKINQILKDYVANKNYDGAILQVVTNIQQIKSNVLFTLLSRNFDTFIVGFIVVFTLLSTITFISRMLNGGRPF